MAEPCGRPAGPRDETRLLEHLEVLRDGRLGHRERRRQLADRQVALGQAGKDGTSGRVRQSSEDVVERWLHLITGAL
jgi:hypothetical protein